MSTASSTTVSSTTSPVGTAAPETVLFERVRPIADPISAAERLEADPHRREVLAESMKLSLGTTAAGLPCLTLHHGQQFMARRPSGATSTYWRGEADKILRTGKDLLVHRNLTPSGSRTARLWATAHETDPVGSWLDNQKLQFKEPLARARALDLAAEHIGPAPDLLERVPLLGGRHQDSIMSLSETALAGLPAPVLDPWIDAPDTGEVIRRLYGAKRYRRSMARLAMGTDPVALAFFAHFRGLAPIEHIEAALSRIAPGMVPGRYLAPSDHGRIRVLLRAVPQTLARRIVAETDQVAMTMRLRDAARELAGARKDPALLVASLAALGRKSVRSSRDLEQVVLRMEPGTATASTTRQRRSEASRRAYVLEAQRRIELDEVNRSRAQDDAPALTWEQWKDPAVRAAEPARAEAARLARIAARDAQVAAEEAERIEQRRLAEAETAAWAQELTAALDGLTIDGLQVVVAVCAADLSRWRAQMHNCIDSYGNRIGLNVLGALVDDQGQVLVNFQATRDRGAVQILGKRNKDLVTALGQERAQVLITGLRAAGMRIEGHVSGLDGLD